MGLFAAGDIWKAIVGGLLEWVDDWDHLRWTIFTVVALPFVAAFVYMLYDYLRRRLKRKSL